MLGHRQNSASCSLTRPKCSWPGRQPGHRGHGWLAPGVGDYFAHLGGEDAELGDELLVHEREIPLFLGTWR